MSQHYFYNGTRIDTFDGVSGTIVSTIPHDSSPGMSLTESDVPGGVGMAFRDSHTTAKPITLTGTIKGTSQADFEQKLDAFKALFAQSEGELEITNYGTTEIYVATFEEGENWSGYPATIDFNYTDKLAGKRSLQVIGTTTPASTSWSPNLDLSSFDSTDTIKLSVDASDGSKLNGSGSVTLRFETAAGTDYFSTTWNSGFVTGWNELSVAIGSMTATGSPSWENINNVKLTTTAASGTVTVLYDRLRFVSTADSRIYIVSQSAPISLPRGYTNSIWCKFQVNLSATEGIARSNKKIVLTQDDTAVSQQRTPLYLTGTGPQFPMIHIVPTDTNPITVEDHFTDDFSSYADATEAERVYSLSGSWSIVPGNDYVTCLSETSASGTVSATLRGVSERDGEIVGLFKFGSADDNVAVFGRGIHFRGRWTADATAGVTLTDNSVLTLSKGFFPDDKPDSGIWLRLRSLGDVVEGSWRDSQTDAWTVAFKTTVGGRATGQWGIEASSSEVHCAFLSFTALPDTQDNALQLTPRDTDVNAQIIDPRGMTAVTDGAGALLVGSFPTFLPGLTELSCRVPFGTLGAHQFYRLADYMSGSRPFVDNTGTSSDTKLAILFSSESCTFIRPRGTFVYLAAGTELRSVGVALCNVWSGLPTTTLASAVLYNIPGQVADTTATFNGSLSPIEVIWGSPVAVTPGTDYALVFSANRRQSGTGTAYMPCNGTFSAPGILEIIEHNGTSWSHPGYGGFITLAGDAPVALTYSSAVTYSPTFL